MSNLERLKAVDVPGREILRCEVGSTLHGIGVGSDDLDLMGVALEPRSAITGLGKFEHFTWRSAGEGNRSGPDDIDLVVYGLKKYVRLATSGNPTVLLPLYAQEHHLFEVDKFGRELRELRTSIVSRECRPRILGYLGSQRRKLLENSEMGRGSRNDRGQKWASHMVRLGFEGRELLSTGELSLPMKPDEAEYCKAIKRGEVTTAEALARAEELEAEIEAITHSPLPAEPDLPAIESWMHDVHRRAWAEIP